MPIEPLTAIAAGASIINGISSLFSSSKANKNASSDRQKAYDILDSLKDLKVDYPELDTSSVTFNPNRVDPAAILQNSINQAGTTQNGLLGLLGQSTAAGSNLVNDATMAAFDNTRAMAPEIFGFSSDINSFLANETDRLLESFAPGSRERREQTLKGVNSFLNFELPDQARNELNNQAAEQAYLTGSVSSGVNKDYAQKLRYDTLVDNFFKASQVGQTEQSLNASTLPRPTVQSQYFQNPQDAISLGKAITSTAFDSAKDLNLLQHEQDFNTSFTNYQQQLSDLLTNYETKVQEDTVNLLNTFKLREAQSQIFQSSANSNQATANSARSGISDSLGILGILAGKKFG